MSEKEKSILTKLARTIPKLDEKKQNYILGVAEGMAMVRETACQSCNVQEEGGKTE